MLASQIFQGVNKRSMKKDTPYKVSLLAYVRSHLLLLLVALVVSVVLGDPSYQEQFSFVSHRLLQTTINNSNGLAGFRTCDGCFCIVENEGEMCPIDPPFTNFTSIIPTLRNLTLSNPIGPDAACNPYTNETCALTPSQNLGGGACVVEMQEPLTDFSSCPESWSYHLRTFSGTFEEATQQRLFVTHNGSCGACSSLQDLAVYMEQGANLREASSRCGALGLIDADRAIQCFEEIGFSTEWATIWYFNTEKTAEACILLCAPFVLSGNSPNGDPPTCPLAPCIDCDETQAGPIFRAFAGRTRRNSGLLSDIIRPCDQVVRVEQVDPCARATLAPSMAPATTPPSSSIRWGFPVRGAICTAVLLSLH